MAGVGPTAAPPVRGPVDRRRLLRRREIELAADDAPAHACPAPEILGRSSRIEILARVLELAQSLSLPLETHGELADYSGACLPLSGDVDRGELSATDFKSAGSDPVRPGGNGHGIARAA